MKNIKRQMNRPLIFGAVALLSMMALNGCGSSSSDSNSNKSDKTYEITVSNNTNNQPLSPVAIVVHKNGYHMWQIGQPASIGLEKLAEGGSTATLIDEASADSLYIAHKVGSTHIGPGSNEVITVSFDSEATGVKISLATMFVNTNDAFSGVTLNAIDNLAVDEMMSFHGAIYDAGTEQNTESAGTIPGPADGGEGFNMSRTGDANFVAIHQGVISKDDGLSTSILNESHRFDNPALGVTIKRTK